MNYDRYSDLRATPDAQLFLFNSVGPKGVLKKVIAYTELRSLPGSYNLGFGTLRVNAKGEQYIDDTEVSDNNDRNKILATIPISAYAFIDKYPDRKIYLTGTDKIRTRLYQMAINNAYDELSEKFILFGDVGEEGIYDLQLFKKGINYNGFLAERR